METTNTTPVVQTDLQAQIDALRAENDSLRAIKGPKAPKGTPLGNKMFAHVSAKGGVSVYGFGRYPITLYKDQWMRLFGVAANIIQFIKLNEGKLKTKEQAADKADA